MPIKFIIYFMSKRIFMLQLSINIGQTQDSSLINVFQFIYLYWSGIYGFARNSAIRFKNRTDCTVMLQILEAFVQDFSIIPACAKDWVFHQANRCTNCYQLIRTLIFCPCRDNRKIVYKSFEYLKYHCNGNRARESRRRNIIFHLIINSSLFTPQSPIRTEMGLRRR